MNRQLELINDLVADGRTDFTFRDAVELSGASTTAVANALHRLAEAGLVDRVSRAHYVVRPLGSLGTSTATDEVSRAVAIAFTGLPHRIAYASALSELGWLTHPVRTLYIACTRQVRFTSVSGRPLKAVIESPRTIHVATDRVDHSWRSSPSRALLECAMRIDLAGGPEQLAVALAHGFPDADPDVIRELADLFGPRGRAAQRRLASLAHALKLPLTWDVPRPPEQKPIRLDPMDESTAWVDDKLRVIWNVSPEEMRGVVEN